MALALDVATLTPRQEILQDPVNRNIIICDTGSELDSDEDEKNVVT